MLAQRGGIWAEGGWCAKMVVLQECRVTRMGSSHSNNFAK